MLGSLTEAEDAVIGQAFIGAAMQGASVDPVLVNGRAGVVITVNGRPFAVMGFTVAKGKIVEIDAIAEPERVRRIAAAVVTKEESPGQRLARGQPDER